MALTSKTTAALSAFLGLILFAPIARSTDHAYGTFPPSPEIARTFEMFKQCAARSEIIKSRDRMLDWHYVLCGAELHFSLQMTQDAKDCIVTGQPEDYYSGPSHLTRGANEYDLEIACRTRLRLGLFIEQAGRSIRVRDVYQDFQDPK